MEMPQCRSVFLLLGPACPALRTLRSAAPHRVEDVMPGGFVTSCFWMPCGHFLSRTIPYVNQTDTCMPRGHSETQLFPLFLPTRRKGSHCNTLTRPSTLPGCFWKGYIAIVNPADSQQDQIHGALPRGGHRMTLPSMLMLLVKTRPHRHLTLPPPPPGSPREPQTAPP